MGLETSKIKGNYCCPFVIYVCMLHSLSGSGILIDSAPAMQALRSKGTKLDSHPPIHTMLVLVIINVMIN